MTDDVGHGGYMAQNGGMMDIRQAAIKAAQGEAVLRATWSQDGRSDDYHRPLRMARDRRLMSMSRGGNNWYEASLTIEDVLADDWITTPID